ncbi:BgTH12-01449 [Blumeria graminis f. sp. triticale]|uniref:Riboflavin synthase n=2 Tax=Blumeria graminis TaxID=34373 RepID=A0A061HG64_BLUGR|nr:Riboflavin synthase [Blumeria graminis f. sp. tritici 96224]CAD6501195.1 BgTH12-01449 [Blumeria graminis f. sp. triticale]
MFTGIVEAIGVVKELNHSSDNDGTTMTIADASSILTDCHLGDSISINGTCLTVTWFDNSSFKVGIAPETQRRTNLGTLTPGSRVNLERAVSGNTRMGGHFVQGHIDTVATIISHEPDGNAITLRLQPRDRNVLRYIVEKGYVALDGASLTITKVNDVEGWWEVMLIAYTQERIVTSAKKVGDLVNVEVDQLGKYVEKAVESYFLQSNFEESNGLHKMITKIVDARLSNNK